MRSPAPPTTALPAPRPAGDAREGADDDRAPEGARPPPSEMPHDELRRASCARLLAARAARGAGAGGRGQRLDAARGRRRDAGDRACRHGTIGGGRLEWEAILRAREPARGRQRGRPLEVPLGPAVGQCCGGHVTLAWRAPARPSSPSWPQRPRPSGPAGRGAAVRRRPRRPGAGPRRSRRCRCGLRWIDGRAGRSSRARRSRARGRGHRTAAGRGPGGTGGRGAIVVMTHSHALDFESARRCSSAATSPISA